MEELSGVKAHTIRIWEQRYAILSPKRTKTNIRYYTEQDLLHLLNIVHLKDAGMKISNISKLTKAQIHEKVAQSIDDKNEYLQSLDALTLSMIELDETTFSQIIDTNINQIGFIHTMLDIIYPLMDKMTLLSVSETILPVQANFVSLVIRQKLLAAINNLARLPNKNLPHFLLYLPQGEDQELSILFLFYLLKSKAFKVTYIGKNIAISDFKDVFNIIKPQFVYSIISESFINDSINDYLKTLTNKYPNTTFLFSGYQVIAQSINPLPNLITILNLDDTIQFLDSLMKK